MLLCEEFKSSSQCNDKDGDGKEDWAENNDYGNEEEK